MTAEPADPGIAVIKPITIAIVYLFFSTAYLSLLNYNLGIIGLLLKPIPILLLAFAAWRWAHPRWHRSLILALLFSAVGDVLLAAHGMVGGLFTAGLASFLVAQVLYAQCFWRHRGPQRWRVAAALAYLPLAALVAWRILPGTADMAVPVALYSVAITAMVTGAAMADRPLLLLAGALSFALSDAILAIDHFISPVPGAGVLIMGSYYLAQGLLCAGALQAPGRATA